jgi:SAM-dependent methyltransferase
VLVDRVAPDWAESFFGDDWLWLASSSPPPHTAGQVDLLVEHLGLHEGTRVLDLACGRGWHSHELARRAIPVVGLDFSDESVVRAQKIGVEEGLDATFLHGDMRALTFENEFDAVVNLGSSFGYADDPADDEKTLLGIARSLHVGGRFALETINPYGLLGGFVSEDRSERPDGSSVLQKRRVDVRRGRIETVWTIMRPDGSESTLESSMRLYTVPELEAMLMRAGFSLTALLNPRDGGEVLRDSLRMMVIATRNSNK